MDLIGLNEIYKKRNKKRHELAFEVRQLSKLRFVKGVGGNFSHRIGKDQMIIKPKGRKFRGFTEQDFTWMDLDGNIISGSEQSSEWLLHSEIYKIELEKDKKNNPQLNVIIHTHPTEIKDMFKKMSIEQVNENIGELDEGQSEGLNPKEIGIIQDFKRGSKELAKASRESVEKGNRILILWKHGLVTIGENIDKAIDLTENACDVLEYFHPKSLIHSQRI